MVGIWLGNVGLSAFTTTFKAASEPPNYWEARFIAGTNGSRTTEHKRATKVHGNMPNLEANMLKARTNHLNIGRLKGHLGLAKISGLILIALTLGLNPSQAAQIRSANIVSALSATYGPPLPQSRPPLSAIWSGRTELSYAALSSRRKADINIPFAPNVHALTGDTLDVLLELGDALKSPELAEASFLLVAHTDASGSHPYNDRLSRRRADAVRLFLISVFGIAPERILTSGQGRKYLKHADDPFSSRNRRVEIIRLSLVDHVFQYRLPNSPNEDWAAGNGSRKMT